MMIWLSNTNDFHFVVFSKSCVETGEIRSLLKDLEVLLCLINPLSPDIQIQILQTGLHAFP